jgi:glycine/serine hydroxymethyltransferase
MDPTPVSNQGDFFIKDLSAADPDVQEAIRREDRRQLYQIELIASKNYLSRAGRQALASIFAFTAGVCMVLKERGYDIVTGGTDSPTVMIDLTSEGIDWRSRSSQS